MTSSSSSLSAAQSTSDPVVSYTKPESKTGYIVAIVVGIIVVVGAGGFGGVGLLKSHKIISLSEVNPFLKWLSSAITSVGRDEPFWGLWGVVAGGVVVGGVIIAFGSYNIHGIRKQDKEIRQKQEHVRAEAAVVEKKKEKFPLSIDTCCHWLGIKLGDLVKNLKLEELTDKKYVCVSMRDSQTKYKTEYRFIYKAEDGTYHVTRVMDNSQRDTLQSDLFNQDMEMEGTYPCVPKKNKFLDEEFSSENKMPKQLEQDAPKAQFDGLMGQKQFLCKIVLDDGRAFLVINIMGDSDFRFSKVGPQEEINVLQDMLMGPYGFKQLGSPEGRKYMSKY